MMNYSTLFWLPALATLHSQVGLHPLIFDCTNEQRRAPIRTGAKCCLKLQHGIDVIMITGAQPLVVHAEVHSKEMTGYFLCRALRLPPGSSAASEITLKKAKSSCLSVLPETFERIITPLSISISRKSWSFLRTSS